MMRELKALSIDEAVLPIVCRDANGTHTRRFVLREMTCDDMLVKYTEFITAAEQRAVENLRGKIGTDKAENFKLATEEALKAMSPLFVWLLREPADGQPAPDEAWISKYLGSAKQRQRIVEEQDRLNNMEALAGNAGKLLFRAAAAEGAKQTIEQNKQAMAKPNRAERRASAAKAG